MCLTEIVISFIFLTSVECQKRIVGGRQAKLGEFPSIVAVYENDQHICGGTLIRPKFVLSAAHCFDDEITDYKIMGGDIDHISKTAASRTEIYVGNIITHPSFDYSSGSYDFAVLELVRRVDEIKEFHTVQLAEMSPANRSKCQVAGWGLLRENALGSSRMLMTVEITVYSFEECSANLPLDTIPEVVICAGRLEGDIDACTGDSGGPLYCGSKLAGVVSFGKGCARPGNLGAYANVTAVLDWIDSTTKIEHVYRNRRGGCKRKLSYNSFQISLVATMMLITKKLFE